MENQKYAIYLGYIVPNQVIADLPYEDYDRFVSIDWLRPLNLESENSDYLFGEFITMVDRTIEIGSVEDFSNKSLFFQLHAAFMALTEIPKYEAPFPKYIITSQADYK